MKINILQLVSGAKEAKGITVIIDVFRAFTMEAYFMALGAEKVIPVGNLEVAYELKKQNPEYLLSGERFGDILPGCDMGNSPSSLLNMDLTGKTIVHTTSAGTQGVANAVNADEILGASLVNARATAEYIKKSGAKEVSLVCMGYAAMSKTEEDTLCAEYIKSLLEGKDIDIANQINKLKFTSGAKFFDEKQKKVFPTEDFYLCTELNKFDFVLKLNQNASLPYMEKKIII